MSSKTRMRSLLYEGRVFISADDLERFLANVIEANPTQNHRMTRHILANVKELNR